MRFQVSRRIAGGLWDCMGDRQTRKWETKARRLWPPSGEHELRTQAKDRAKSWDEQSWWPWLSKTYKEYKEFNLKISDKSSLQETSLLQRQQGQAGLLRCKHYKVALNSLQTTWPLEKNSVDSYWGRHLTSPSSLYTHAHRPLHICIWTHIHTDKWEKYFLNVFCEELERWFSS